MNPGLKPQALLNARSLFDETHDLRYAALAIGVAMANGYGSPQWALEACAKFAVTVASVLPPERKELRSTSLTELDRIAQRHVTSAEQSPNSARGFHRRVLNTMASQNVSYAEACRIVDVNIDMRKTLDRKTKVDRRAASSNIDPSSMQADVMPWATEQYIAKNLRRKLGQI